VSDATPTPPAAAAGAVSFGGPATAYHNSYHNHPAGAVPNPAMPSPDAADAAFAEAADRVLADAAELARLAVPSHQSAATVIAGGDWATGRKHFSLSAKYAAWADYATPAAGVGTHRWLLAEAARRGASAGPRGSADDFPVVVRYTNAELEAHPAWMGFGTERGKHPPMRGRMAAPIVGRDGTVWGLLQLSDRADGGDYSADDEAAFARVARLATAALEALWDVRLLRRGEPTPAARG
jgi:GAF domain-containing protein